MAARLSSCRAQSLGRIPARPEGKRASPPTAIRMTWFAFAVPILERSARGGAPWSRSPNRAATTAVFAWRPARGKDAVASDYASSAGGRPSSTVARCKSAKYAAIAALFPSIVGHAPEVRILPKAIQEARNCHALRTGFINVILGEQLSSWTFMGTIWQLVSTSLTGHGVVIQAFPRRCSQSSSSTSRRPVA
jgi:hypothetical protein